MNLVGHKLVRSDIPFLKWRKENVQYLIDEYIPFILSKLNTDYSEVKNIQVKELTGNFDNESFNYMNLKLLSFEFIVNNSVQKINVKLPVPVDDIFIINKNYFILVNVLNDHIYYLHEIDKTIYTVFFRITNKGMWYPYKGSQIKSQKGVSLPVIMRNLFVDDDISQKDDPTKSLLFKWCPDYRISDTVENLKDNEIYFEFSNDKYFVFRKTNLVTKYPFAYKLIQRGIEKIKSTELNVNQEILNKLQTHNLFDYSIEYEFLLGYRDQYTLYDSILKDYRENELINYLKFKRISYYSIVLQPFEKKIQTMINILQKTKNKSFVLKIPNNLLTKKLKSGNKFLQYLELKNPFEEINTRTKLVTPLDNVPKYMRNTIPGSMSYICPLDTPDNKQIGVVNHIAYNCELDLKGYFKIKDEHDLC